MKSDDEWLKYQKRHRERNIRKVRNHRRVYEENERRTKIRSELHLGQIKFK